MKKALLLFSLVCILAMLTGTAQAAPKVKNIILMISDGWGQAQIDATTYYNGYPAPYLTFPKVGMTNFMYLEGGESEPYGDGETTGLHGYDPAEAWADWYYMQNYATDSAAAATSMSTGHKTYQGAIGMGPGDGEVREELRHYFEDAEELGLSSGVVTSVQLSHATPASFIAHSESRNWYDLIAQQMIASDAEVIMGCGHPHYDGDGQWSPGDPEVPGDWKYVGGYEAWQSLVDGTAGGDRPWTLIEDKADFEALASGGPAPERVFGVAQVSHTLQYNRSGMPGYNSDEPPYTVPFIENVPSLETMTRAALNVLDDNPEGFVCMIEGGAVDWAGHGRTLGRLIEEQTDFDNAVQAVMDWVQENSNWGETVLIVTGDHETGFLWGPGVDPADESTWFAPVVDNGPGQLPGGYFYSAPGDDWSDPVYSAGHTNEVIPFYVRGGAAGQFLKRANEHDPVVGRYLDNTEVAETIFLMLDQLSGQLHPRRGFGNGATAGLSNYPNPFNPMTTISFNLTRSSRVSLNVYDLRGNLVKTLVNDHLEAASHEVQWNGTDRQGRPVASGVYYCLLQSDDLRETQKLILTK